MDKLKTHLFICTNKPDQEGHCGFKQSEAFRRSLKEQCSKESWSKNTRINSSGCLGQCEKGIVAVLYPEGDWFLELTNTKDCEDLLFQAVKSAAEKHK